MQEDRSAGSQVFRSELTMTDNRQKRENPMNRLSDVLEEHLLQASDQELEEIAREWGVEPAKAIENVEAAFKDALRAQKQARLSEAKALHQVEIAKLEAVGNDLPQDRDQLLALLEAKLAEMRRDNPTRVTIQHRNLEALTEEGLRSLLKHLSMVDDQ